MQELNWGGWWNWDMLEVSSAFLAVTIIWSSHVFTGRSLALRVFRVIIMTGAAGVIFCLNKLGVSASIHSFAASSTLRRTFIWFTLLGLSAFLVLTKRTTVFTYLACFIVFSYYSILQMSGLKVFSLATLYLIPRIIVTPRLVLLHKLLYVIFVAFGGINALPGWYQFVSLNLKYFACFTLSASCVERDSTSLSLFNLIWLAKPVVLFDAYLNVCRVGSSFIRWGVQ